ncbi:unnamed protein product, partial [Medioppia subpectinata]
MTRDQMTDMRDNLKIWFEGHRDMHCDYYLQNRFLPLDQYYELRSKESGWLLFTLLVEICADYSPPESVLKSVPMDTFRVSTTRLALAVDDYITFKTKMAANDVTNGLMAYAYIEKCRLQTAIDTQFQLIKDLEAECQSLSDTIATKLDAEFETPALVLYMNSLIGMSYGMYAGVAILYAYEERDGLLCCP